MKLFKYVVFVFVFVVFFGCDSPAQPSIYDGWYFTSWGFNVSENPTLSRDYQFDGLETFVTITENTTVDLTSLRPFFEFTEGSSIPNPSEDGRYDFSDSRNVNIVFVRGDNSSTVSFRLNRTDP